MAMQGGAVENVVYIYTRWRCKKYIHIYMQDGVVKGVILRD